MRVHIAVFAALALCCLVSKSAAQTTYKDWVWIDDYTIAGPFNNAYYDNTLTLPVIGSPMYYTDPVTPSVKILGGQRDTQITITAGPDGANFAAGVTAANFTCSTPFQGFGYTELQYDGKDFNPNLNINGLNNADLTAGGNAVQFHTIVASDIPTILHIRIYSGAAIGGGINDYCYFNFSMPGSNIFKEYKTDFTAFQISGLGCDFTRVGAVDAVVDMTDAADSIVSFLSTYGPVPSPSASISVTASQTPTPTPSSSLTPSPTPSVSISSTPSASSSTTPTISESPSPSITSTPSPSASPSPTPSPSASSSVSATASPTPTISESPSPSITATPSPSATVSPSLTPSPTVSPSLTASVSVTISETSSKSESRTVSTTPSVTPPPSQSPSPTPTRTPSASPSGTPSPSFSASPTRSNSASVTPTQSYSSSPTKTPSITRSPSQTGSFSRTRSSSVTRSPNMTPTPSVSATTSASISNTRSPSVTASVTLSRTKSPSRTPSPTVGYQIPTYVTYCSGQPSYDPTGRTGSISIDQAFLNAWLLPAPNGGCAHLATYSSEAEFSAIYDSMVRAGATGGKATIIGGRRYSSSSYAWGAGAIRGQAYVEPVDQTASLQIARANCLQGFCLRDMSQVEPITNVNQVGIAVLIDNTGVAHLVPSAGAECYTVELDAFSLIPNSDGGQDFQFVSTLADFDTHQANANLNRQYLARVSGATQNQWIQDELQCATFNVWLGYETNPATLPNTNALRLSAGPSQGTIILSGGQTTCSSYCNFASGFSGIAAPGTDLAVSFVSNTGAGKWSVVPQANSNSGLRARDICAAPAPGYVYICKPSTLSTAWRQSQTTANAAAQVATGTAFYAGGPYSTTIGGVNTVFYFDCNCRTDYRIDLTCLAQRDPRSCTLYYLP